MYETSFHANIYTYKAVYATEFLKKHPNFKFFIEETSYILQDVSFHGFVNRIVDYVREISYNHNPKLKITGMDNTTVVIETEKENALVESIPLLITVTVGNTHNFRAMKPSKRSVEVLIHSSLSVVTDIFNWLDATYAGAKIAQVNWWYKYRDSSTYTSIPLDEPFKVKDIAYPYIKGGAYNYFKEYLDSKCPLLFLSGPPGTGKTSFLRAMIWEFGLIASVSYDEDVLLRDEMFINFITGDPTLLILEDSESVVTSRAQEKNSFMSRFLNVSDGLIKTKSKKIIFTTNFKDFSDIDEALTRPGRCFDFLEFRPLTWGESIEACTELDLNVPTINKEYTIAELYNQEHMPCIPGKKVGF